MFTTSQVMHWRISVRITSATCTAVIIMRHRRVIQLNIALPCHADATQAPVPVVKLQGHRAPVVAVTWAFDERRLASADCDGTVIVWKREHAENGGEEDAW